MLMDTSCLDKLLLRTVTRKVTNPITKKAQLANLHPLVLKIPEKLEVLFQGI